MKITYLASSSEGNATLIETTKVKIVLDIGLTYKKYIEKGGKPNIDIILITHEHSDHSKGLGVLGRKTKATIFMPELSYEKFKQHLKGCKVVFIKGGQSFTYKDVKFEAFGTKHDSADSVGYSILDMTSNKRYTHITDTGTIGYHMIPYIQNADGLFLESDYDIKLLDEYDEYPKELKERIASAYGHMSNQLALNILKKYITDNKKWVVLGHLSKRTNNFKTLNTHLKQGLNKEQYEKVAIFIDANQNRLEKKL